MILSNALDFIFDLQRIGIKFGLTNTKNILHALGDPHQNFKIIHIAGTNGKGSTAAMTAAILHAAGFNVGLYTSPHLIRLAERIQVNGSPIPERDLLLEAEEIRRVIQGLRFTNSFPTFFEAVTCLAFSYFSREKVDFAVIEVGMGGRLDATNVCHPLVSVITSISLEHQEYLGNTIAEIASEKAGIIKAGRPVVTAVADDEALKVISETCTARGVPLYSIPELYSYEERHTGIEKPDPPELMVWRAGKPFMTITPPLRGGFQIQNTLLVLEVIVRLRELGIPITDQAIQTGLSRTVWPGRLQVVSRRPFFVLDGAHNPDAAKRLAEAIRTRFSYENLILVLGILKDKDIAGICQELIPLAHHVILSEPISERAASSEELSAIVVSHGLAEGKDVMAVKGLAEAIAQAKALAREEDLILVTGSLYTLGEVMAHLGIKPYPDAGKKHDLRPI